MWHENDFTILLLKVQQTLDSMMLQPPRGCESSAKPRKSPDTNSPMGTTEQTTDKLSLLTFQYLQFASATCPEFCSTLVGKPGKLSLNK